jgi:hypothetical protein
MNFISSEASDNGDFHGSRDDKLEAIYVTRMVSEVSFYLKRFSLPSPPLHLLPLAPLARKSC